MRKICARTAWLVLIAGCVLSIPFVAAAHGQPKKVRICHEPPGHSRHRQTIIVSEDAVSHHLRHGDSIGACPSGCEADPSICDDQSLCTSDSCNAAGECVHQPVDCNDGNTCTRDSCAEASGCVNDPVPMSGSACDDQNVCTGGDVCQDSACSGGALPGCCLSDLDCTDANLCTIDQCVGSSCVSTAKDCSLGEVCGIPGFSDACVVSFCNESDGSCATTPVDCDDGNLCTVDYCNGHSGCGHVPTATGPEEPAELSCDDGLDNDCDGAADSADPDCMDTCTTATDCAPPPPATCTSTGSSSSTLTVFTSICSGGVCGVQETVRSCLDAQCSMCGGDACTFGSSENETCGMCGIQSRVCGADRQWGAWSACAAQGVCQPGSVDEEVCGCGEGTRPLTCTAACQWQPAGGCTGGGGTICQ